MGAVPVPKLKTWQGLKLEGDYATMANAWWLGRQRARQRWAITHPTHQVSMLRTAAEHCGLNILAYEWECGSRPYWFDILAETWDGQLLVLDGTWDCSAKPNRKNKALLKLKAEYCQRRSLPYLYLDSHDPSKLEVRLRQWLSGISSPQAWGHQPADPLEQRRRPEVEAGPSVPLERRR